MYKHPYIVEVEERPNNIFVVKFYLKAHRHSENRYSLTLSKAQRDKDGLHTGAHNLFKVMNTLLMISKVFHKKTPTASFGFIGAPKFSEMDVNVNAENINPDGTYRNTSRFRVYKNYVARYYPPSIFDHIEFKSSSGYMIKNKMNKSLTKDHVEELFLEYITPN